MKWIGIKNLEAEFLYKNKMMSLERGCNINNERSQLSLINAKKQGQYANASKM